MSAAIWRFPLTITDVQQVPMPKGARPLSVAPSRTSGDELDMWVHVDPEVDREGRTFLIVGTGNPMPDVGAFVGTAQTHGGALVWHVFEGMTA